MNFRTQSPVCDIIELVPYFLLTTANFLVLINYGDCMEILKNLLTNPNVKMV